MKKRSTLMALILALFTVILGLNSVHAEATNKTVITDKIWWRNDYGDPSHPFEKADDFKYIGDVASNNWGVFYFSKYYSISSFGNLVVLSSLMLFVDVLDSQKKKEKKRRLGF